MILSKSRNFVFVHIPKTAGTSLTRAIEPSLEWCDISIGGRAADREINRAYWKRNGIHKHAPASALKRYVGDDFWKQAFSFAIMRDPVERAASTWRYLKSWKRWAGAEIMDTFDTPSAYIRSDFFSGFGPGRMHRPQKVWLDADIKYTGLHERLDDEVRHICSTLGIPHSTTPKANISPPEKVTFDADALAIITNRYACDFALIEAIRSRRKPNQRAA